MSDQNPDREFVEVAPEDREMRLHDVDMPTEWTVMGGYAATETGEVPVVRVKLLVTRHPPMADCDGQHLAGDFVFDVDSATQLVADIRATFEKLIKG